jgi:hypothetical protein
MNNAFINKEYEDVSDKALPIYREQVTQLTEVIEALQNIQGSSYWKVLKQFVFDVDLEKAKRRLALEEDTTEIFRLQGEIRWAEKFNLEELHQKKRKELLDKQSKIHE